MNEPRRRSMGYLLQVRIQGILMGLIGSAVIHLQKRRFLGLEQEGMRQITQDKGGQAEPIGLVMLGRKFLG